MGVPHTPRYRARSYSWGGLLRIKNIRVSDYGLYSCRAKNSQGQVTSNKARLNIKGSWFMFVQNKLSLTDVFPEFVNNS